MRPHVLLAFVLIAACTEADAPDDDLTAIHPPVIARTASPAEALANATVPTLDPHTLNDAEIVKSLPEGPRCDFRYTTAGAPVLAVRVEPTGTVRSAIVKLNGYLIPLHPAPVESGNGSGQRLQLVAEPIRIDVEADSFTPRAEGPETRRQEADMTFAVGTALRVGYGGFLDCALEPRTEALGHK